MPVGEIPGGRIERIVSFRGGYVAQGGIADSGEMTIWFSTDGRDWTAADIAEGPTCDDLPSYALLAAGSEDGVVVLGIDSFFDVGYCARRIVVWSSPGGKSWQLRHPFESDDDGFPVALWATPEGWEAIVSTSGGVYSLWRSEDALNWTRIADLEMAGELSPILAAAFDPAGIRLISVSTGGDIGVSASALYRSDDGVAWREIAAPPVDGEIGTLVPPTPDRRFWTAQATDQFADFLGSTIAVSEDLTTWRAAPSPMGTLQSLVAMAGGAIAYGRDVCQLTGGTCGPERTPRYVQTTDGVTWVSIGAREGPTLFVDGPAGVLGFDDDGVAWRLEPYTEQETFLFERFRDDARFACAARRTDLPERAVAGVVCSPDEAETRGVDEVGAYLFQSDDDMLKTYFDRLADEGIRRRDGACPTTPGEMSYHPEAPGELAPARMGCFVNDFGNANLRITYPEEHVYVGVLGTDTDMSALWDWGWKGNLDQPGAPTIWNPPAN